MSPPPPPMASAPPPPPPTGAGCSPLPKPPPARADELSSLMRLGAFSRHPHAHPRASDPRGSSTRPRNATHPQPPPPQRDPHCALSHQRPRTASHPTTQPLQPQRDPRVMCSPPAGHPHVMRSPPAAASHPHPHPHVNSIRNLVQPGVGSAAAPGTGAGTAHAPQHAYKGAAVLIGDVTAPPGDGFAPLTRNFGGLVRKILAHPLLPLVVSEMQETATGRQLQVGDARSVLALRNAQSRLDLVAASARSNGLEAPGQYEVLDVYLASLCAAFGALRAHTPPPVPQPLHAVLSAANVPPPDKSALDATREDPGRAKIPERAKAILERWFADHFDSPYPQEHEKRKLAQETGLRLNQINNYFGNRRMRTKRKRLEQDATIAKGGMVGASVLAPRTKWRTIVRPDDHNAMHPFHRNPHARIATHETNHAHNALVSNLFRGSSVSTDDDNDVFLTPAPRATADSNPAPATTDGHSGQSDANAHTQRW